MASEEVKAVEWTCDACGARAVMTELDGVHPFRVGYHGTAYQAGSWGGSGGAAWWACRRSHITRAVIAAIERGN